MSNILLLFPYFKCYLCSSDAVTSRAQSFFKVLLRKAVQNNVISHGCKNRK